METQLEQPEPWSEKEYRNPEPAAHVIITTNLLADMKAVRSWTILRQGGLVYVLCLVRGLPARRPVGFLENLEDMAVGERYFKRIWFAEAFRTKRVWRHCRKELYRNFKTG